MAFKATKNLTMEDFVSTILPFCSLTPGDLQETALYEASEGNDFQYIARDILFTVSREDVLDYYSKNKVVPDLEGIVSTDGFAESVAKVSQKRGPGRPKKAEFDTPKDTL
jgi:hypothetical protein